MSTLAGLPLYEATGFTPVEHLEEPAGGVPVPLVRMRKDLPGQFRRSSAFSTCQARVASWRLKRAPRSERSWPLSS